MELWLILALSYAFLHALVAVFDKQILKNAKVDALALSAIRFSINAVVAFIFVLALAVPFASGISYPALALSVLYFLAAVTYFYALKAGEVSKLIPYRDAIVVLLSFFLAVVLLSEKFVPRDFLGVVVIILGGYIVWADGKIIVPKKSAGIVLIAISAVLLALIGIVAKLGVGTMNPLVLSLYMYFLDSIYVIIFSFATKRRQLVQTINTVRKEKKLIGLVLAASIAAPLGVAFQFYSLSMQNAAKVLPVSGTLPLFAALIGWLVLKEKHGMARVIGAVLLIIGIYILSR
ncbi:EamA-like transporter family protein [uncultured archaeon]|nr:EamA-like transporter family protein [uncultured archaeon]